MYNQNSKGKCPHCSSVVVFTASTHYIPGQPKSSGSTPSYLYAQGRNPDDGTTTVIHVYTSQCPGCHKPVATLVTDPHGTSQTQLIYPLTGTKTAPAEVPPNIASDYNEASLVLNFSEKASAALSRRCLQNILHDQGIDKGNLSREIDEVLPQLPGYISESLDAVRSVGNFAAHPIKETSTGNIVEVEEHEAE